MKTYTIEISIFYSDNTSFIGTPSVSNEIDTETAKLLIKELNLKLTENNQSCKVYSAKFTKAKKHE